MKIGNSSWQFKNVYIQESAVVVGPKENAGPLGKYFDFGYDDVHCNEKSWEKAEIKMAQEANLLALKKSNKTFKDIDLVISGDLNNQIIVGNYLFRDYDVNYMGVFNACASSIEGVLIGANVIDASNANNVMISVSSHNGTAERQFRYPTEYGGQKPDSMTSTTTAATSIIIGNQKSQIRITRGTVGKVIDYKMSDATDMGRTMAPAAYQTLKEHLEDFKISTSEYDLIVTGDLSYFGKDLFLQICDAHNLDLHNNYEDCGLMIYDRETQDVQSGGSGCGCLPGVAYSFILNQMRNGIYKKVLLIATGALHNPIILAQKESIPGIAHAVALEVVE